MEAINVLVTMPFPDNLIDKLANVSPRLNVIQHPTDSVEELPQDLSTVDVIYTLWALPNPDEAPRLRWVQLHSAGLDHVQDTALYAEKDITLTTTSGIHAPNMSEYVVGQMLAFGHHFDRMYEDKQDNRWPEGRWDRYVPRELRGKTVGIVGYGSIGREIARLTRPFGMEVLAIKNNVRQLTSTSYSLPDTGDPEAEIPDRIYPIEALHSFLSTCDFVVLTLPLTDATYHLIDANALNAMKDDALLINVSRGDVVDEEALLVALEERKIGGAALDVFSEEPLPEDHPLWEMSNVTLSPHVSGFTPHYDDRATDLFAENLRRFIVGEDLLNVVDRERGY